jgi:hypothetical protein
MFVIAWLGLSSSFSEVPLALSSVPDNQRLSSTTSPSVYTQYQAQYYSLISHILPLPLNPPKQPAKVQYVAGPNHRGTYDIVLII